MKNYYLLITAFFLGNILVNAQNFEWAGSFGGMGEDVVRAMAVDDEGNSYITGYFTDNSDMDPTESTMNLTSNGFFDIFIQKVDTDGNLVWVRGFGGDFFDYGTGIEVDDAGSVYITGVYQETVDFDPDEEAEFNLTSTGAEDIFVLKLDSNGDFEWAKSMGGEGYEESVSIGIDDFGNVYVAGYFQQPGDYDPGEEEAILTSAGSQDAFIVKLDAIGNHLWSGGMGGSELDLCLGMDVDSNGDTYITGSFTGTADFDITEGVAETTSIGDFDAYVTKLNALGEHSYTANIGGTGSDIAWDVAIGADGTVYAAGGFRGEFETGISDPIQSGPGTENVFVSKINAFGGIEWSACLVGEQFGNAYDVNTDPQGNVIVAGYFSDEIDFDPSDEDFILTRESTEPFDAFVVKLNSSGELDFAANFGGANFTEHHGVDTDANGNIYLSAAFQNTVDINPSPDDEQNATVVAFRDSYIIKLTQTGLSADVEELPQVTLHPNPAMDNLSLTIDKPSNFRIVNSLGQTIRQGVYKGRSIDVTELNRGLYIIEVSGYQPAKFLKK